MKGEIQLLEERVEVVSRHAGWRFAAFVVGGACLEITKGVLQDMKSRKRTVVVNSGWARFLEVISVILGLVLLSCPFGISAGANDTKDPGKALNSSLSSSGDVSVGNTSRVETDPDGIMVADAIRQMIAQHAGNGLLGAQLQRANQARAQLDALNQLKTQVGQDLKVHFRPGNQTVAQVRGKRLERAASGLAPERVGVATERTSQVFLQKNRALLRLDDPSVELTLVRRESDEAGGAAFAICSKVPRARGVALRLECPFGR
jgi:hypothetical protein